MLEPDWSKVDVTGDFYTFARSLQSVISHVATCALKFYPSKVSDYFPEWHQKEEAGFDVTINGEFFLWFGIYKSDYQKLSPEERLNLVRETWDGQVMTYREQVRCGITGHDFELTKGVWAIYSAGKVAPKIVGYRGRFECRNCRLLYTRGLTTQEANAAKKLGLIKSNAPHAEAENELYRGDRNEA